MKRTLLTLAAATTMLATSAFSQRLDPDCERIDQDTIVLKFRGEPITAIRTPARIPLKRLVLNNCRINERRLDNIERVVVAGESYTRSTSVWLEGQRNSTQTQYLSQSGRRGSGVDRAVFDLPRRGTPGRLQVLLQGDLDLKRIRVVLAPRQGRGGRGGDGGRGGNGGGRDDRASTYSVTCESNDFNGKFCSVPGIVSARVVNQLSDSACIEGYSFGLLRDGISVSRGCRAVFQVQVQNGRR